MARCQGRVVKPSSRAALPEEKNMWCFDMLSASTVSIGSLPLYPLAWCSEMLARQSERIERRARQADAWGPAAGERTDHRQHVLQPHIGAAQDVVLADAAFLQRQQMALGDVVDMDEIEAGIDIGRHAAIRGLDDDAPGRRRLDVARPDRRWWTEDHGGATPLPPTLG